MTEALILVSGVIIGAAGIAYGLQVRAEFHERDRWQRFEEAMRAGGRDQPLPKKED